MRRPIRFFVALAILSGCTFGTTKNRPRDAGSDAEPIDSSSAATRHEVVIALANNVVLANVRALESAAVALETATQALAANPTDTALRTAAQDAWRAFEHVWQRVQVMQVGPLGAFTDTLAGLGIRDEIDSWPLLNLCGLDEETAMQSYSDVTAFATKPANRRGVTALEFLLFDTTTGHHCASTFDATWSSVADVVARRAAYAHTAAQIVHQQATRLRNEWEPAGNGFVANFAAAGTSGSVYMNVSQALNAISDALFYVDLVTKDMKIAIPAGVSELCGAPNCPQSVESRYAAASLSHLRDNLLGFRGLVVGGPIGSETALGFDDLLIGIGQAQVAQTFISEIDGAIAAIDAIGTTLESLVVSDPTGAMALYAEVKNVTDLLKTQFAALLDLEVPATAAGDND